MWHKCAYCDKIMSPTMSLYQHRSCKSSSCPCSSPPGCKSTAGLQAGSPPSNSSVLLLDPATRTVDCHLQHKATVCQMGARIA